MNANVRRMNILKSLLESYGVSAPDLAKAHDMARPSIYRAMSAIAQSEFVVIKRGDMNGTEFRATFGEVPTGWERYEGAKYKTSYEYK